MRRTALLACGLAIIPARLFAQTGAPHHPPWGLELQDVDTQVKHGGDFYAYALGSWLRTHQIPVDKVRISYNYDLPDEIKDQVRRIVERSAASRTTPTARKIGNFYFAWMRPE